MSTAKHAMAGSETAPVIARAMWNGMVLAETTRPVLLEGNTYFPPEDVRYEHLANSGHWSLCAWKAWPGITPSAPAGSRTRMPPGITRTPARSPARSKTMWRSGTGCR